ncbi:MAG TPA: flagellar filament capping protein FliD [Polyangia bacterium]|nr:flagellar filament capping protein FliD [Polyangia bacterium]
MADSPFFSVGGLASGLDTTSIIEGLTKLEQRPLDSLRTQQEGFRSQISLIGQLVGKIKTLQTAAQTLSDSGTVGMKTSSTNTDFTATGSAKSQAGTYTVAVQELASAALKRSGAFLSDTAGVTGGTLSFTVQGTTYDPITITDGMSLADVAGAIRGLGAPISAVVLNDGTSSYLSITNLNTGYTGTDPTAALQITESYTGSQGKQLALGTYNHDATNSAFTIDGLGFTRQTNTVTDALPGTTLSLKAKTNTQEKLTLDVDSAKTALNLQNFVNAYNDIINTVATQLGKGGGNSDRNSTLAGDSTLRSLVSSVQGLVTTTVNNGSIRSLADVGIKTNFLDGTLTLDSGKLGAALQSNSAGVNNLFAQATTGMGAVTKSLGERYTNIVDGMFTSRTKNLNSRIKQMDRDAERLQLRVDAFKQNLTAQFTAMEKVVAGLKASGSFLSQQMAAASSNS